ncbi:hypothetical protein CTRI78_v005843 [Colletotrichum trifolii]|uniref:Uncharacterized protein n=1 Tax=Colletotrichum trifolii TaxID=5466 RepID=A0A4R8RDV4_COLTR|nr:hypothetical protein CTRI78_v005843 [Colletotrichum trifolii]
MGAVQGGDDERLSAPSGTGAAKVLVGLVTGSRFTQQQSGSSIASSLGVSDLVFEYSQEVKRFTPLLDTFASLVPPTDRFLDEYRRGRGMPGIPTHSIPELLGWSGESICKGVPCKPLRGHDNKSSCCCCLAGHDILPPADVQDIVSRRPCELCYTILGEQKYAVRCGRIVVTLDHPYNALLVQFPDGSMIRGTVLGTEGGIVLESMFKVSANGTEHMSYSDVSFVARIMQLRDAYKEAARQQHGCVDGNVTRNIVVLLIRTMLDSTIATIAEESRVAE